VVVVRLGREEWLLGGRFGEGTGFRCLRISAEGRLFALLAAHSHMSREARPTMLREFWPRVFAILRPADETESHAESNLLKEALIVCICDSPNLVIY
jgi:hypothetical protein